MLNINTRISLSKPAKRKVRILKSKNKGKLTKGSWDDISKSVKNEISMKLLQRIGVRCVYCERYLSGTGNQIDHFAHKADYPEFTFISVNLFYSCSYCNSSSQKGQRNTIYTHNIRYDRCSFLVVHPFYDNPEIEIVFQDRDRIYFDWFNCTQLGKDTIEFFNWDNFIYSNNRSKLLIFENMYPLTSNDEIRLIQEIIAYKK